MRIRDPKTTALIFASGKMVVTGAKSEDDSRLASRKYARIIQKLGFDAKFAEFKIQNIVGSCDVKFPIRLEGLAFSHGAFSSYEPEVCRFFYFLGLGGVVRVDLVCLTGLGVMGLGNEDNVVLRMMTVWRGDKRMGRRAIRRNKDDLLPHPD